MNFAINLKINNTPNTITAENNQKKENAVAKDMSLFTSKDEFRDYKDEIRGEYKKAKDVLSDKKDELDKTEYRELKDKLKDAYKQAKDFIRTKRREFKDKDKAKDIDKNDNADINNNIVNTPVDNTNTTQGNINTVQPNDIQNNNVNTQIDDANTNRVSLFRSDFDNGVGSGWNIQSTSTDRFKMVDDPTGQRGKVLLDQFQEGDKYFTKNSTSSRSELRNTAVTFKDGNSYDIKWSALAKEQDFDATIAQVLGYEESGRQKPRMWIRVEGDEYKLFRRTESKGNKVESTVIGDASQDAGKWTDWNMKYKASDDDTGGIEIFKNKQKIFAENNISTLFNNDDQSYFKVGIYKNAKTGNEKKERNLFLDYVDIGVNK